jgi:7-cyano-7-deazaguanine synthase in queuosine biosynthesis
MIVESKAIIYNTPNKEDTILKMIAPLYDNFNKKEFDKKLTVFAGLNDFVNIVYNAFNQQAEISNFDISVRNSLTERKRILLAFSGGLDSVYQALILREQGYEVVLFHVKNMNFYTNGQEYKVAKEFADKFKFQLVEASMKFNKEHPEYKKVWKENPVKNEIFFAMMIGWLLENGGNIISSGDDLRLSLSEAVPDTNLSDAKEMTESFLNGIKQLYPNLVYLPIEKADKSKRLKFLDEHEATDYYYSCVTAGRLVRYLNQKAQEKYNIKLDKWTCGGACRKCAMHDLLRYYYQGKSYPEEYINKCWDTISKGADNVFFDKSIPLETRIKNLIDY